MSDQKIHLFDEKLVEMPAGDSVPIIASNGLFIIDRVMNCDRLIAEGCTKAWEGVYQLPGLKSMEEGLKYHLPLIPSQLLEAVEGLFDWVVDTHHSESMVLLYFSPLAPEGKQWQVRSPLKQIVTQGSIQYKFPDTPRGFSVAGDIHSHTDFNAFHSGVDHQDEEEKTGLFITLGHNGSKNRRSPEDYDCSFMIRGKRFPLNPEQVFEGFKEKFISKFFPDAWRFTVEKPAPVPTNTNIYSSYNKNNGHKHNRPVDEIMEEGK